MLHKDNSIGMGALLPEGQANMMPGPFVPPPSENPWIAAAGGSSVGMGVPLMPPNPIGPFGPGPAVSSASQGGGDLVSWLREE